MKPLYRFVVLLALLSSASLTQGQKSQPSSASGPSYIVGILPFGDASGNEDIGPLAKALPKLLQATLLEHTSLVPHQLDSSKGDSDSDDSGPVTDAASAAALGKAKHADLVLMGQILSGNVETKDSSFSGPSIRGLSMGSKARSQTSLVVLQVDVIDASRGQRIASFRATGRNTQNKIDPSVDSGYGSMDMTSTGFKDSSLGRATQQALNDITDKVVGTARTFTPAPVSADSSASDKPAKTTAKTTAKTDDAAKKADSDDDSDSDNDKAKPSTTPAALDGLVADVSGKTMILNVGKNNGVQVGDKLKVSRTSREIKDPATGKLLRRIDSPLGVVTITQVDDTSSEGTYSGAPGVKVGDHVKR